MPQFNHLLTPRLTIRRLRDDDLDALVAYRAMPEVMRLQMWEHYDHTAGQRLIDDMQGVEPFTPASAFPFGVALAASDKLIGDVYFKTDEAGNQAEVGYSFSPRFQGMGYASEALRGIFDHAFRRCQFHRIYATTDPHNTASIKLLQRLGMKQEAHFRQNLWFKGAWADDVVFAILEKEWTPGLFLN